MYLLYKYSRTSRLDVLTGETVGLFNPRKNEWVANFRWSVDVSEIIGISAIGRVTVIELKFNRIELKNLRSLLASVGKPPI